MLKYGIKMVGLKKAASMSRRFCDPYGRDWMIMLGLDTRTGRLHAVPTRNPHAEFMSYKWLVDGGRLYVPTSMEDIAKKVALGYAEHRDREARLSAMRQEEIV